MISRCPSCGAQVKEDENSCASCGWDFTTRKHLEESEPAAPIIASAPEEISFKIPLAPLPETALEPITVPAHQSQPIKPVDKIAPPLEIPRNRSSSKLPAAVIGATLGCALVAGLYAIRIPKSSISRTVTATPNAVKKDPPQTPVAAAPAAPVENKQIRPSASFAAAPHVVVLGRELPASRTSSPDAPQPGADAADKVAKNPSPRGPTWNFEGAVFDLLTARGVFAARIAFIDNEGNSTALVETGQDGRYKVSLPALENGAGYSIKVSHQDYADRWIDEGAATSSLREASPEERKILTRAVSRHIPWIGAVNHPTQREIALVPRTPEEN